MTHFQPAPKGTPVKALLKCFRDKAPQKRKGTLLQQKNDMAWPAFGPDARGGRNTAERQHLRAKKSDLEFDANHVWNPRKRVIIKGMEKTLTIRSEVIQVAFGKLGVSCCVQHMSWVLSIFWPRMRATNGNTKDVCFRQNKGRELARTERRPGHTRQHRQRRSNSFRAHEAPHGVCENMINTLLFLRIGSDCPIAQLSVDYKHHVAKLSKNTQSVTTQEAELSTQKNGIAQISLTLSPVCFSASSTATVGLFLRIYLFI